MEVRHPGFDILDQLLQCLPAIDAQTTLAGIGVGLDDFDATVGSIFLDFVALIFRRVLLVLGGHPDILCSLEQRGLASVSSVFLFCHR